MPQQPISPKPRQMWEGPKPSVRWAVHAAEERAAEIEVPMCIAVTDEGGNLVATNLLSGSFIDLLRAQSAIMRAGITMLTGLVGNLAIPKQTGGATAYWVGEDTAPSQSGASFGQVPLTPHTVGAFTEDTRRIAAELSPFEREAVARFLDNLADAADAIAEERKERRFG